MLAALIARLKLNIAGTTFTILLAVLVASWGGWTIHVLRYKAEAAIQAKAIADKQHELDTIRMAAELQQAKVDAAVALADRDWDKAQAELAAIKAKPLPKTPEEARLWALEILKKEGK